ncbi:pilus assembly protein [Sphingomonas phyllosphaerae]|uniref:pilus assembly protein n=1 Tax=Sphingomonas phyllosphaerae TaxID=257003 RepID=UPI0003F774F5|nr:pilus assembly protein [Sphingomonas phyllosphaerae]
MPFILSRALSRLLRDAAGNVAIMAAFAVIPLLAMVGGAIDASRTYMAYTRLQQACDSGALAGRKAMSNVTQLTDAEKAKAGEFFRFNFPAGTYAAEQVTAVYEKGANGVVVGRASLSMPTTLMRMFGFGSIPVSTTCQAELNIPNTDVMFVLDVTGSMNDSPIGGTVSSSNPSKLDGLKQAVKDFYKALGPGPATGPGRIRYGFMPYSSNVNVGRIVYKLSASYIAGGTGTAQIKYPSRTGEVLTGCYNNSNCEYVYWSPTVYTLDASKWVQSTNRLANPAFWSGKPTGWNDGAPSTFAWDGCIREASTVQNINASSPLVVPALAYDLQIDLKPNSDATRWKPAMTEALAGNRHYKDSATSTYRLYRSAACPREAGELTQYTSDYVSSTKSSATFDAYVDDLSAGGQTYHDIGLMWGARFLSPTGIFSATNADSVAPGGYQVSRHIVFMTDGTLAPTSYLPDAWGVNSVMNKVQADNAVAPPTASDGDVYQSHLRRTQIICNEMKKKGFIIWIVGFSSGLSDELKACATDRDHWAIASDTASLRKTFAKIAQTIGGLRLSS